MSDFASISTTNHRKAYEANLESIQLLEGIVNESKSLTETIITSNIVSVEALKESSKRSEQEIHGDFLEEINEQAAISKNCKIVFNELVSPTYAFVIHIFKTILNLPLFYEYEKVFFANSKLLTQYASSKKKYEPQTKVLTRIIEESSTAQSSATSGDVKNGKTVLKVPLSEKTLAKHLEAFYTTSNLRNQILANECLLRSLEDAISNLKQDIDFIRMLFLRFSFLFTHRLLCRGDEFDKYTTKSVREAHFSDIEAPKFAMAAFSSARFEQKAGNNQNNASNVDATPTNPIFRSITVREAELTWNLYFGCDKHELRNKVDLLGQLLHLSTSKWHASMIENLIVIFNSITLKKESYEMTKVLLQKYLNHFQNHMYLRVKLQIEISSLTHFMQHVQHIRAIDIVLDASSPRVLPRNLSNTHLKRVKINSSIESQFQQSSSLYNYALHLIYHILLSLRHNSANQELSLKCPESMKKSSNSKLMMYLAGNVKKMPVLDDKEVIASLINFLRDSELMIELLQCVYNDVDDDTNTLEAVKLAHNIKYTLTSVTKVAAIQLQHILRLLSDNCLRQIATLLDSELNYSQLHCMCALYKKHQSNNTNNGQITTNSKAAASSSHTFTEILEKLLICLKTTPFLI